MQHSLSIDQQILRKQSRATLFFLLFLFNSDFAFSVVHRRTIWLVLMLWCSGYSFQNARFFSLFRKDVFVCVPLPLLCLMLLLLRQSRVECYGSTSHWCLWEFNDRAIFLFYYQGVALLFSHKIRGFHTQLEINRRTEFHFVKPWLNRFLSESIHIPEVMEFLCKLHPSEQFEWNRLECLLRIHEICFDLPFSFLGLLLSRLKI